MSDGTTNISNIEKNQPIERAYRGYTVTIQRKPGEAQYSWSFERIRKLKISDTANTPGKAFGNAKRYIDRIEDTGKVR